MHFSDKITLSSAQKKQTLRRGYIRDTHGTLLAVSIEEGSVYANPEHITDPVECANKLAPLLQMNAKDIYERLILDRQFIWLKRKLPDHTVVQIESLNLPGIYIKNEFKRVYPHDTLASHIIGFTDIDSNGISGIEYKYDSYLKGEKTIENVDRDNLAYGYNVNLTIDRFVQYTAEKYLYEAAEKHGASKGAVLVMDVTSGKILACAVYPPYNPNYYYRYTPQERSFYSVVNPFEPGSTMKIFAAGAWLRSDAKDLNRTYHGSGEITLYDTTIQSTHVNGWITLPDAVRLSCNVSVIRAMKDVSSTLLYDTLTKYGFSRSVCNDFPGEASGMLRPVALWSGLSKYSISIGYEISVTSLQLTAAYAAIANGGIYIEPSIIESIEMNNQHRIQEFYPQSRGRIMSAENSTQMRKMLRSVVTDGTGKNAAVASYKTAGKTGTAYKASHEGGYEEKLYTTSFVGFAPYNDPRIAVTVVVDEPQGITHGGEVAAPAFASIVSEVLPYLGEGINSTEVPPPEERSYQPVSFDGVHMPDFLGQQPSDITGAAASMQRRYNVQFVMTGDGRITKQRPQAGEKLQADQQIILTMERDE